MSKIIVFPRKEHVVESKTPRLDSVLTLGNEPIDVDAKFIAYAITELTTEERTYIKQNPLVFDPIKTKLKKLGWEMDNNRFIEAYTHLLESMKDITDK